MIKTYYVESHYDVHGDEKNAFIRVREDLDGFGLLEIVTVDDPSREYYGSFRVQLTPKLARLLAEVMIKKG